MEKCKKCGANLRFDPNNGNLICDKCGNLVSIKKEKNYTLHDFDMNSITKEESINPKNFGFHCPNCGASFRGNTYAISDICDYCGGHLVADLGQNVEPDGCIPFAFDIAQAKQRFKKGLSNKWFLPNKFKKEPPENSIESVYIPAYLCNTRTVSSYSGRIYNTDTDKDGKTQYHYKNISGTEAVNTDNMMVECSSKLTQATLDQIKPYVPEGIFKYKKDFLLGYTVEYFDKNLENCKALFKEITYQNIRRNILWHYNYDGVDYLNINTQYVKSTYAKVILPAYCVNYTYKNKKYSTFMNGQTGKVGGNVPRSGAKIATFVTGILVAIGIIAYLICKFV